MEQEPIKYMANQIRPHPTILKQVPSSMHKDLYQMYDRQSVIIIDYGSQTVKAGYDLCKDGPCMVFRPQVSKTRDPAKTQIPIKSAMNLSYDQLDFSKVNFKSPFEKNIILHFSILEQCNDYIFSEIVRPNKPIGSPIIISESFANPLHCRMSVLEQFFECYQVNEVFVGVDALFAYFYQVDCNIDRYQTETALVVSMGASTIHVFCIINGKVDYGSVRRINIGGNNSFDIFAKTLLLKHPQLKSRLSYGFLRDIYEKFTCVAVDYKAQLRYFQQKLTGKKNINEPINNQIYHNRVHEQNREHQQQLRMIQNIEIDFDVIIQIPEEQIKRKEEMKLRMADKLRETIERRKKMKQMLHEKELENYIELRDKYETGDKEAHEEVVEMFGPSKAFDKLLKKIHGLEVKLGKVQDKADSNKYALVDVPDHQLPPEKLKLKRIQVYQKSILEIRKKKLEQKKEEEQKMKDLRENTPQLYLHQLKEKYRALSEKMKQSERIKSELNNRKSRLKQKKMQVLARLAEEDYDQNEEQDPFAKKEAEDSDHYSEIQVMEAELRQIDPDWSSANKDIHHLNSSNQMFLSTELFKCHQIYFQPRIGGCMQAGLTDAIICSIQQYSGDLKAKLLKNILVTGGSSQARGLKERLQRELMRQCPTGSQIKVQIGKGGYQGAYYGMQSICRHHRDLLSKMSYQKDAFLADPSNYHVSNPWSNPKPTII